jgi:ethylene-insensitive protein 3
MNSPFETNHGNKNIYPMYGSSCDLASFDFKEDLQLQGGGGMDALYKQPYVSIWNYQKKDKCKLVCRWLF